ncbi:baseplate J protein [Pasteurellaceae bacterium Macca]|nr:baseplate J protein [Pasteurellaceae bacterium Macca]
MFTSPTFDEIREAILRDIRSLNPRADTANDSDNFVRASALAALGEGIYAHLKWQIKQFFPDTADTQYLERHAGLRGLRRKNATYASGVGVTVKGNEGAVVPVGAQVTTKDGRFYETTATATVQNGQAMIAVKALAMGASQNIQHETPGQFMAAPNGVQTDCVLNHIVGGTDAESDASLLERLLELIRRPPAGGNRYDYKNWALNIDGVTAAFVYPLRRGLGTVDIAITAGNDLPSEETVRKTQAYIDDVRPVTAKEAKVVKPDVARVDFEVEVRIEQHDFSRVKQSIEQALADYFNRLQPADDLILSQCEAIISDLSGVVDRRIVKPVGNRKADIQTRIDWFRLGNVVVREMRG